MAKRVIDYEEYDHSDREDFYEEEETLPMDDGEIKYLDNDEACALIQLAREYDSHAIELLIGATKNMIPKIAKRYQSDKTPFEDLYQEGIFGILKAIDDYDPNKNTKFSTHAYNSITHAIRAAASSYRNEMQLTTNADKDVWKIKNVQDAFYKEYGREPSIKEIHEITHFKEERIEELLQYGKGTLSMDYSINEEDETTFGDTVADRKLEQVDDGPIVTHRDIDQRILTSFENKSKPDLSKKEIYEEIAREEGITPERVRQIIIRNTQSKNTEYDSRKVKRRANEKMFYSESDGNIKSNMTRGISGDMAEWIGNDKNPSSLKSWDDFYHVRSTEELISKLEFVDFYTYFISYCVYHFSASLIEMAKFYGIEVVDESDEAWKEALKNYIYEEIILLKNDGKAKTPGLDSIVSAIQKAFLYNGYANDDDWEQLRSNLFDDRIQYKWNGNKIKQLICGNRMNETDFFNIAVGMDMEYENVEIFLTKVLQRSRLNLFNKEELILYIAFKYVKGNKARFIDQASRLYDKVKAEKMLVVPKDFNTSVYTSKMEFELAKITADMNVFDDMNIDMHQLEKIFAHLKYLLGSLSYQRTANREFLGLMKTLEKLTEEDREATVKPLAKGVLLVSYDVSKGLILKEKDYFVKQRDGKTVPYYVDKELMIEPADEFSLKVDVECTETTNVYKDNRSKEKGHVDKGTQFKPKDKSINYIKHAENGSYFKASEKKGNGQKIIGSILITFDAEKIAEKGVEKLPKGTIFEANKYQFALLEDILLVPVAKVQISGEEIAKKNTIKYEDNKELFPQIKSIDHEGITFRKKSNDNDKYKIIYQSNDQLYRYLHRGADGNNTYGFDLNKKDSDGYLRQRLYTILEGKTIDFPNRKIKVEGSGIEKLPVKRDEILTLAFLVEMAKVQFSKSYVRKADPVERVSDRLQRVNDILMKCGFYEVYLVNPYDCLLLYISTFEAEPMNVYRNLWGNLLDYEKTFR